MHKTPWYNTEWFNLNRTLAVENVLPLAPITFSRMSHVQKSHNFINRENIWVLRLLLWNMPIMFIIYDKENIYQSRITDILPETNVTTYQSTSASIAEERGSRIHGGGSPKCLNNEAVSLMMQKTLSETFDFASKILSKTLFRLDSVILILHLL
jgi:hypothetical protein